VSTAHNDVSTAPSIDKTLPSQDHLLDSATILSDIEMKDPQVKSSDSKSGEGSPTVPIDIEMKDHQVKSSDSKSGEGSATVPNDIERKDPEVKSSDSKSGEGSAIANPEPEVECFLRGITHQLKWQELVSKWLAFEKDYPIKGVFSFFLIILVTFGVKVIVSRTYPLQRAQRKLPGG
jgi:hypothetical protein